MEKSDGILGNFIWRLFERFGAQGVTLVVSIVLARVLEPEVYGTIALVTVFTNLLNVFIDSGLGTALIQKRDADDLDFSSVFFFNIVMCLLLYSGLFAAAPWIAAFYEIEELTPIVRVLGLMLVISGVKNIQQSYISRNMLFKKFFFATIGGTISAAVVGISMAYLGFGVWALVCQYLFNAIVGAIVLWIVVDWRPKLMFSFKRLKALLLYGSKILCIALTTTIYEDIRQLLIGKFYTTSDLAFYNKAKQFPTLLDSNINASIASILLPVMSKVQDDLNAVKVLTQRSVKMGTYFMAPILVGFAMCGDAFVELLLTEKWLPCVPYMRIFCFTYIFTPIVTSNHNAYKSLGRLDLYFKGSVVAKIIGIVVLLFTLPYGVMAIANGLLIYCFVNTFVCAFPNGKLLGYGFFQQMKDIIPTLLLSAFMGLVVYTITLLNLNAFFTLAIQIIVGVVVYVCGSIIFKFEAFNYVVFALRKRFIRQKGEEK